MENTIIDFILIGECGSGKTYLGNFLFGKELLEVFPRHAGIQINSLNGLTIIGTPSCDDGSNYNYNVHEYLVKNLRPVKNFRAILFVLNCGCYRLTIVMKKIIEELSIRFSNKILKNIAFVITNFYSDREDKSKIMKKIPEYITAQLKTKEPLKFFFINSDLKHPEEDSLKEKEKIIEWAKGLTPINTKKLEYENLIFKID
jgi:predicted GTPase